MFPYSEAFRISVVLGGGSFSFLWFIKLATLEPGSKQADVP
jgi:hypothetical protein